MNHCTNKSGEKQIRSMRRDIAVETAADVNIKKKYQTS